MTGPSNAKRVGAKATFQFHFPLIEQETRLDTKKLADETYAETKI